MTLRRIIRTALAALGSMSVVVFSGCGDETVDPPAMGRIEVTVATSGADLDPDGYTIALDSAAQAPMSINGGRTTFSDVPPGQHTISISDLTANCTVSGQTSVKVTVVSRATVQVAFVVTCAAFGAIRITVATSGGDLDPDGYTVMVDGGVASQTLPANGAPAIFAQQAPGTHTVEINGIAANCTASGQTSVTVAVASGATAQVAFAVSCVAFGGVRVTATTNGADQDPDGYTVQVEGQSVQVLLANGGEVNFSQVAPGPRQVTLSGVRANCTVSGSPQVTVTVASGATASVAFSITCLQFMPTGSAIAFVRNSGGNREVFLVTGGSVPLNLTNSSGGDGPPVWSPDGTKIAFVSDRNGNPEIYVMNPDGSGQRNLTNNAAAESSPAWSPDGSRIAFVSDRDGNDEVYVMQTAGSGQVRLTANAAADESPAWSPDGKRLAFVTTRDGNPEIYLMNADGSQAVNASHNAAGDMSPVWSANGTRIAFVSDRDGNAEIYLMNPDGTEQVNLTKSPAADGNPVWSPDGRRIVFASGGIAVINADGTGFARIVTNSSCGTTANCVSRTSTGPVWSPDGSKIALQWVATRIICRARCGRATRSGISVMNPDGSAAVALVDDPVAGNGSPAWRPR